MASLSPLAGVLGKRRAAHLLRRTTFKVTPDRIASFSTLTADEAVDQLFQDIPFTLPQGPISWVTGNAWFTDGGDHGLSGGDQYKALMGWVLHELKEDNSARSKMMLFLHTCFTAGVRNAFYPYYHYLLLWQYCFGNIKVFAEKFSTDNLTLEYLNGRFSTKNAPNEDFGREFLELFTIQKGDQAGPGDYTNYTEHDVQQAARLFTGFIQATNNFDLDTILPTGLPIIDRHDTGDKTFSDRFNQQTITGALVAEDMRREIRDFIEMIFNQPATGLSFATRIYRFFVRETINQEVENDILAPLANDFATGDFELLPVMKRLLKSQHFYDADDADANDEIIGAKIKSPLDLMLEALNFFEVSIPDPITATEQCFKQFYANGMINRFLSSQGMKPFDPPSVKGYDAYTESPAFSRYWFSSNTIGSRYNVGKGLLESRLYSNGGSINWATEMDIVDFVKNKFENQEDATALVTQMLEITLPYLPTGARFDQFLELFLGELSPINWMFEWQGFMSSGMDTGVRPPIERLFNTLFRTAEYQTF